MKQILQNDWPFIILLILLSVFYIWGIKRIPFHPDEATQLYMSSDFDALFSQPSSLAWRSSQEDNPKQRYRELDAPITKYLLGLGRSIAGYDAHTTDWDWRKSWEENILAGAYPDSNLLSVGRLSITLLLPLSLIFTYFIGVRIHGRGMGLTSVILLGTHAVVLLHGRRAMAEGPLLLGVTLATWSLLHVQESPWLTGLGMAFAFNAKQSALALVPVAILAIIWLPKKMRKTLKKAPSSNKGILRTAVLQRIVNDLLKFLLVFLLITFLLNPIHWRQPFKSISASVIARQKLLDQQIRDMKSIAPDEYFESPIRRALMMIANIYIGPAEHSLVKNLEPTIDDVNNYIAIPGHNLFRGTVWGGVCLILTLFGLCLAMRKILMTKVSMSREIIILLIATMFQLVALIVVVPLSLIRYTVPVIPFVCLWIAFGIVNLLSIRSDGNLLINTQEGDYSYRIAQDDQCAKKQRRSKW